MNDLSKVSTEELQKRVASMHAKNDVRNVQLMKRRKRHQAIDFTNENYQNLINEIETELKKRGV